MPSIQVERMSGPLHESWFRRFSYRVAAAVGTHRAFLIATAVVLAWAATGPLFHFSDSWQLVINTGTTIVTFLMVFLARCVEGRGPGARAQSVPGRSSMPPRARRWRRSRRVLGAGRGDREAATAGARGGHTGGRPWSAVRPGGGRRASARPRPPPGEAHRQGRPLPPPPGGAAEPLRGIAGIDRLSAAHGEGGRHHPRARDRALPAAPLSAAAGRRRHRGGEAARRGTLAVESSGPQGPGGEDARWHRPRLGPRAGEALGCGDRRAAHCGARDRTLDGGDAADLPARAAGRAARDRLRRPQGIRARAPRKGASLPERAARPWRALAAVPHRRELVSVEGARFVVAGAATSAAEVLVRHSRRAKESCRRARSGRSARPEGPRTAGRPPGLRLCWSTRVVTARFARKSTSYCPSLA